MGRGDSALWFSCLQVLWEYAIPGTLTQVSIQLFLGSTVGLNKSFSLVCCPQGLILGLQPHFPCHCFSQREDNSIPVFSQQRPQQSQRLLAQRSHVCGVASGRSQEDKYLELGGREKSVREGRSQLLTLNPRIISHNGSVLVVSLGIDPHFSR